MVFARSAINLARPAGSLFAQRAAPTSAFSKIGGVRTLTASSSRQGKVLLCLYDVSIQSVAASSVQLAGRH
jgi:formate dehydrogenase